MNNRRQRKQRVTPKECFFCANCVHDIDYKDVPLLRRFVSSYGKIAPRHRTGSCALHQRKLALSIKRARVMAMMPFVTQ